MPGFIVFCSLHYVGINSKFRSIFCEHRNSNADSKIIFRRYSK